MSWSVDYTGSPHKIKEAIEQYANTLTGQSKEEFDEIKDHLAGIVMANTGAVRLNANGHGWAGTKTCSVTMTSLGALLV